MVVTVGTGEALIKPLAVDDCSSVGSSPTTTTKFCGHGVVGSISDCDSEGRGSNPRLTPKMRVENKIINDSY